MYCLNKRPCLSDTGDGIGNANGCSYVLWFWFSLVMVMVIDGVCRLDRRKPGDENTRGK